MIIGEAVPHLLSPDYASLVWKYFCESLAAGGRNILVVFYHIIFKTDDSDTNTSTNTNKF